MSDSKEMVSDLISKLKQQRDELALQIHLGKKEAQDEWEKVRGRFDKLAEDYEPLKDAVEESAASVFDSMKDVAVEIKNSFDRIRASLSE